MPGQISISSHLRADLIQAGLVRSLYTVLLWPPELSQTHQQLSPVYASGKDIQWATRSSG